MILKIIKGQTNNSVLNRFGLVFLLVFFFSKECFYKETKHQGKPQQRCPWISIFINISWEVTITRQYQWWKLIFFSPHFFNIFSSEESLQNKENWRLRKHGSSVLKHNMCIYLFFNAPLNQLWGIPESFFFFPPSDACLIKKKMIKREKAELPSRAFWSTVTKRNGKTCQDKFNSGKN